MNNKRYSVIIVPEGGRVRQFVVSKAMTIAVTSMLFLCLGGGILLSVDFLDRKVESHRVAELSQQNAFLANKLETFATSIEDLHDDIVDLTEKEKAIRTIFDLPEIDPQQRELGIGGPEMLPVDKIFSPTKITAYQAESTIDRLFTLSSFEKEQFRQIHDLLVDKKSDLDHTPSILPTNGWLSCGYGLRTDPFSGEIHLHAAIDIANRVGTPIVAPADGKVKFLGNKGRLGKTIVLDHGNGFETLYGHCSEYKVKRGQKVARGDLIATMGSTGRSTGPHLHYAIKKDGRWINPQRHILTSDYLM